MQNTEPLGEDLRVLPQLKIDAETARQELVRVARLRRKALTSLLFLTEEQRGMLTASKHDALMENLRAQEQILSELSSLQNRADTLVRHLQANHDREYSEIDDDASDLAERLRFMVKVNTELLQNAMQYVDVSISLISGLADERRSYDPKRRTAANSLPLAFDHRV